MKTTIDFPDDLVLQLKLRAVQDGRKLKDVATEFIREGLARPRKSEEPTRPLIRKDRKTGLMVIQCPQSPDPALASPEKLHQLLLDQEVEWALGIT